MKASPRLKALIWRLTPVRVHSALRWMYFGVDLLPNYFYDFARYLRLSGLNKSHAYQEEQVARVTMAYHQLEKGLSYAAPRPGFGVEVVDRLFLACDRLVASHGYVYPMDVAIGVLRRYVEFNRSAGVDMQAVQGRLDRALTRWQVPDLQTEMRRGGTREVTTAQLRQERSAGFARFFESRHSVRQYTGQPIPQEAIEQAICLAQKTPSVCNRQSVRVHAYTKPEDMARLLAIQAGSRGFGEQAGALLVVTSDLGSFVDAGERYQAWIDGGMFSMSLCLAFHEQGYGSCCLNWSKEAATDRALRQATDIPEAEQVVMMISVGVLPETFRVAYSARRPLASVLRLH